ncbi:hypothetical protein BDV28DRAFT_687 [Aspergillus coremiiformis]|uniref:Receptor L-domain domain-containing protein n=1 Tax=Aspergillus coremiiformis TaxID=138285 RepID=A0A5N6ZLC7_9EURO|nr:hypothetical protein BDV28DRAFT_687 [Aspergillus coremiiformis]
MIALGIRSISRLPLTGNRVRDDSSSCSGNVSITTQKDADALNDCETINGSVVITSAASGSISISKVQHIHGPFTVEGTSSLNAISVSNLETVSGSIAITNNGALNSLSLANLESIGGGLSIRGNGGLTVALGSLEKINGNLMLTGNFNQISLSSLENVYGKTQIQSSGSFSCSSLDKLVSEKHAFKGPFSCSEKESGLSPGAKAGIAVGVIIGVILIVLLIWFCIRRQKKSAGLAGVTAAGTAVVVGNDIEKGDEQEMPTSISNSSPSSQVSPSPPADVEAAATSSIPRKPVSPPPQAVPAALVPGDRASRILSNPDDPSLFLRPMPMRQPSESEVPMLDSYNVHEAPPAEVGRSQEGLFELDAGPVRGTHQQVMHHG